MMKRKKKKTNLKGWKSLALYALILLILMGVLLALNRGLRKEVFQIKSRVEKVESTKIGEDDTFDTVGWIRAEGTLIDVPIIWNTKEMSYPVADEGFAWTTNKTPEMHNRLVFLGHNILNLSDQPEMHLEEFTRFEDLMSYVYYDFAKEHKYIQLTLNGKEYVYKIFSVGFIPDTESIFFPIKDDYTEKEMKTHLKVLEDYNLYDYDIDVNEKDSILSLVTCTRFYGTEQIIEFYVTGRLVRENEKNYDYKVEKSDLYPDLEKILKGDEDYENA